MINFSIDDAKCFDRQDVLGRFRDRFAVPAGVIYLDGNSLGALPIETVGRISQAITREWGDSLIKSWNAHQWMEAPLRVGGKIAQLIGAECDEVVACDSTSINLFKSISAARQLRPERRVILSELENFPNDLYIMQGIAASAGGDVEARFVARNEIMAAIDETIAAVVLTHVHYKSAAMYDMAAVTRRAHEKGAVVVWDLSHSTGAVRVNLNESEADFAVGCGYKYLNGGPGCPAFLFVARRHQDRVHSPITGWLGHAKPFDFTDDYQPARGIARFLCGAHPVLGLLALEKGVDLMLQADMEAVIDKSRRLCELFIDLVEMRCGKYGLRLETPRDAKERGSHVSFSHPHAYEIVQALIDQGVIGDFRAPHILRFGFTPLYVSFTDVWTAVDRLLIVLRNQSWKEEAFSVRKTVT